MGYSPHEIFFGEPPKPLVAVQSSPVSISFGEEPAETVDAYVARIRTHLRSVHANARTMQARYEAGLEVDYEQYPVAGSRYGNSS